MADEANEPDNKPADNQEAESGARAQGDGDGGEAAPPDAKTE